MCSKKYFNSRLVLVAMLCCVFCSVLHAQKQADKPLFRDPVYDGAADPVVIWNAKAKKWYMLYTNRRANVEGLDGVTWVHGTRIGIATSTDGANWQYLGTANINYRPVANYTHWAPDVVEHNGVYHMFLTYVPGVFADWRHPRSIIHCTSNDLLNWNFVDTLPLASERCIDASVYQLPDGSWRMWYNNEMDKKSIYYADSKDLYHWESKGKVIGDRGCEGPKVFRFENKYWMIVDFWKGMAIYSSDDLLSWKKQQQPVLDTAGHGAFDQAYGGHADVLVNNGKAWLFYFTHPAKTIGATNVDSMAARKSLIQLTELKLENGMLVCNRDTPAFISLQKPFAKKRNKK
ncbi:MAG TPA: family 43 glycosylhydrolase [Phnomibacter sp.]|nr:family 43 glycosylhydrolase [Phnomibacter sp.]